MSHAYVASFSLIIQGGNSFYGPFEGRYPIADVRVRVWRMCDFPAADFKSANEHNVSVSGTRIFKIYMFVKEKGSVRSNCVDEQPLVILL